MYGDSRPRVTPREFSEKVRPILSGKGFTDHQLDQVEAAFHAYLAADPNHPDYASGVDEKTLESVLAYVRSHPAAAPAVGPEHWKTVEQVMKEYIETSS